MESAHFSGVRYPHTVTMQPPSYDQPASQTTYVVQPGPTQAIYVSNRPYLNFTGAIVLSCIVFWCCGCLFGLIAFILAMIGQSTASNGDGGSAKSLLISSYVISAVGIVAGIILISVLAVVSARAFKHAVVETSYGIRSP